MKNYLKYILGISVIFLILPVLARLLGEDHPVFIAIVDTLQMQDQIVQIFSMISATTSGSILGILILKEKRANSIINKASWRDDFWNDTHIKNHCRLTFYSMYDSLLSGNHADAEKYLAPEFYRDYFVRTPRPQGAVGDLINPIDIVDTKVVSTKDMVDNTRDEVSVVLTGEFVRPHAEVNQDAVTFPVEKKPFQILFTFKRCGSEWKLDKLDDYVTILDLLQIRSQYEH